MADRVEEEIAAVEELVRAIPGIRLAIVFGSVAQGTASPGSDLDVAVDVGHPLSSDEKIALIGDLAVRTGRPVDLVDLRTAGEPILGQILKGRRVAGSTTCYAELVRKHLFDAADFLPYRERILRERRLRWIGKS